MPAFGPETPVLLPDVVEYSGAQRWLLWPALRYRVVAPLVYEDRLNMFQNAVLGLARSGYRDVAEISALLGLEPDLVALVRNDLRELFYLDERGSVTERGRAALRDGFIDPTRNVVTFVYQDPFTGTLWPASTIRPEDAPADWQRSDRVAIQLRTAGAPLRKSALPVQVLPDEESRQPAPGRSEIVEAVARGERARRRRSKARRLAVPPPDRVVSRVSMIGTGQPVWLPVVLRLRKGKADEETNISWEANSPFTGYPSTHLRRLVQTRAMRNQSLRECIEQFVGYHSEARLSEYERLDVAFRRHHTEMLELTFTTRLREHPDLVELLTLLERDFHRVKSNPANTALVGNIAHLSWQVHEAILRDVITRFPVASTEFDEARPAWQYYGECCRAIGLPFAQSNSLRAIDWKSLRKAFTTPVKATTPMLLAASVVSAAHGDSAHPVRQLACGNPRLIELLTNISGDRNEVVHGARVVLNREFGEIARHLARETTAAYLGVPTADRTRTTSHEAKSQAASAGG
ncbi:MAG TPA: hypothetical protein VFX16_22390 [Pseudonocardiaceae bacterium]|nr:hypothetical protein [Pseudonocardiaceae bacterium]